MIADVTTGVSCGAYHQSKVDHFPEKSSFKHKLNIVLCSTIELKRHVLRSCVKALNEEVALLAPSSSAPAELDDLSMGRQEKRTRLIRRPFVFVAEIEMEK